MAILKIAHYSDEMPQRSECLIAGGGKSSDLMDSPLGLVLLDVLL
jgi:hypothetical protein